MQSVSLSLLIAGAAGHGMITFPPGRNGGSINISGCINTPNNPPPGWKPTPAEQKCLATMSWFCGAQNAPAHCKTLPGPATIPEHMWTSPPTWNAPSVNLAWRAPGTSMPVSPCGSASATEDGTKLPPVEVMSWQQGTTAEVAWSLWANHGGGYTWRLCPQTADITEECFSKYPLNFASDKTRVQWTNGSSVLIDASTTSSGTTPAGSQWRRNPIPSLEFCESGACECPPGFTTKPCPAFEPPCPFCWGAESDNAGGLPSRNGHNDFSLVDTIQVPNTPGRFVLQWRWDTELAAQQVWTNCADVLIGGPALHKTNVLV
jgi:hypothetical protein